MGKVGFKKGQHSSKKNEVAHAHVAGPAYEINDPVTKLIHMTGVMFNEPTYYGGDASKETGLTEDATTIIQTAQAVAETSPEDLLVVAAWTRDAKEGRKLRTTPQVLLAVAANNPKTRPFLEKYSDSIVMRADDIKTAFASYMHLFASGPKRTLPRAFKNMLARSLARQSSYSLVKYNNDTHPTFRDVFAMIKGSKIARFSKDKTKGWPLEKGLFEYLSFGKVSDNAPDIVRKRTEFFKNKDITKIDMDMVEAAGLTWENVISHLGSSLEAWRLVLPFMGEMAITRNLRNFEQAGFEQKDWDVALKVLSKVEKTVQLPFRYLAAYREISSAKTKTILGKMFDKSIANVPQLPGKTVIFVDNSGSMDSPVSGKSKMSCKDAGNSLGAILAKKNEENADIYAFGTTIKKVEPNYVDSGITILENIESVGRQTGGGTNIDEIERKINEYRVSGTKVDRFIILSDLCAYHMSITGNVWGGANKGGLQRAFSEYKRLVNKDAFLYSINLQSHSQTQVDPADKGIIAMAGFSEQIFTLLLQAEGLEQPKNEVVPTIELLRQKYGK